MQQVQCFIEITRIPLCAGQVCTGCVVVRAPHHPPWNVLVWSHQHGRAIVWGWFLVATGMQRECDFFISFVSMQSSSPKLRCENTCLFATEAPILPCLPLPVQHQEVSKSFRNGRRRNYVLQLFFHQPCFCHLLVCQAGHCTHSLHYLINLCQVNLTK